MPTNSASYDAQTSAEESAENLRGRIESNYASGEYWQQRMDMIYYHYVDFIVRTIGKDAASMIDVGSANTPYLEWFDWIPERVSFDMVPPYQSDTVTGIQGDFLTHDFGRKFELCTCLQVLEHVTDPEAFAHRLLEISDRVIVSVPFGWGKTAAADHLHDPIDYKKLTGWMGRKANYRIVAQEPFRGATGRRLIAIYDKDPNVGWGRKDFRSRVSLELQRTTGGQ